MASEKILLSLIESTVLGPTPPTPLQRIELLHAIRHSLPSFQSLLSYPPPKPSDRVQVQSKEVRLPDSGPISLDDQDVQIALKLSDDLHLNEVDSVRLLVSANQENAAREFQEESRSTKEIGWVCQALKKGFTGVGESLQAMGQEKFSN